MPINNPLLKSFQSLLLIKWVFMLNLLFPHSTAQATNNTSPSLHIARSLGNYIQQRQKVVKRTQAAADKAAAKAQKEAARKTIKAQKNAITAAAKAQKAAITAAAKAQKEALKQSSKGKLIFTK